MSQIDNDEMIEKISSHIKNYIGPIDSVIHEMMPTFPHIDVFILRANEERAVHTLITCGMSSVPMTIPKNTNASPYLELMMVLPGDWPLPFGTFENIQNDHDWPINLLKTIATFPHDYHTWLGYGHTLSNGNPPAPFAEHTDLNAFILLPSLHTPQEFHYLNIDEGKEIEFLSIVPIYQEERDLVIEEGSDALLKFFDQYKINDLVNLNRINVGKQQ